MCKISPAEFWKYSPGETLLMIEVAGEEQQDKIKLDMIYHADLKVAILNAPWSQRKRGGLYQISDFVDKEYLKHVERKEISPEEQAKRVSEAGRALANKCDMHLKKKK